MTPGLSSLTPPQARIIGAILALLVWLAPAFGVWLYMRGQLSAQYDLGKAAEAKLCSDSNAKAMASLLEGAAVTQKATNEQARKDAQAIAQTLGQAKRQATRLTQDLQAYAQANPLPADCRADAQRVRLYNDARTGNTARP